MPEPFEEISGPIKKIVVIRSLEYPLAGSIVARQYRPLGPLDHQRGGYPEDVLNLAYSY